MRDIARAAGVHASTVSRALMNHPAISPAQRERIQRLAREMGYRPDPIVAAFTARVRTYRRRRDPVIIAALDPREIGEADYSRAYRRGAQKRADELGYKLDVIAWPADQISIDRLNRMIWTRAVHGLIVFPSLHPLDLSALNLSELAVVLVDPTHRAEGVGRVQVDYFQGMELCLRELARRNRVRPLFCVLEHQLERIAMRWLGAFTAHCARNAPNRVPPVYIHAEHAPRAGFEAALSRWSPDALIANDLVFFDWARACGRVPPDVAHVSLCLPEEPDEYGGIRQPSEAVGAAAVDLVVSCIHRNQYGPFETPLVIELQCQWRDGPTVPPKPPVFDRGGHAGRPGRQGSQ